MVTKHRSEALGPKEPSEALKAQLPSCPALDRITL